MFIAVVATVTGVVLTWMSAAAALAGIVFNALD
jgi:hypothetical protein